MKAEPDNKPKTTEELPKEEVAKKVVTPNKHYFFPEKGKSVQAESLEEAQKKVEKDK